MGVSGVGGICFAIKPSKGLGPPIRFFFLLWRSVTDAEFFFNLPGKFSDEDEDGEVMAVRTDGDYAAMLSSMRIDPLRIYFC